MHKSPRQGIFLLTALLVSAGIALSLPGAHAQVPNPKQNGPNHVKDSNIVNLNSIRQSYFERFPYAKQREARQHRVKWDDYPITQPYITLGSNNQDDDGNGHDTTIWEPNGNIQATKSGAQQHPDMKAPIRPQYWPLEVPCGSPVGYFKLPTPPLITNKSILPGASAYGGVVIVNPYPVTWPKCYTQDYKFDTNSGNLASAQDEEIWDYELTTFGVGPISDTQYQMIDREDNQRFMELAYDPERWMWTGQAMANVQGQGLNNSMAGAAEAQFSTAVDEISDALINVANENAGVPTASDAAHKTIPQAVWMVQQAFKNIYIPMAILLLLPGAVMTQMKTLVSFGMLGNQDEDTISPFTGILRSIIAIFLIPATQLFVSYAIDIGNSMTLEVKHYLNTEELLKYTHEQTYNPPVSNYRNTMSPPPAYPEYSQQEDQAAEPANWYGGVSEGNGKLGKGSSEAREEVSEHEKQTNLSQFIHFTMNMADFLMSTALVVLTSFQLVMMCYLYLLGPIAASFFAWPSGIGAGQNLFKKVFTNWMDGVTILALWRFWWMVVLACMCTRIEWLKEIKAYTPNTQWEGMMYTCFMGLLMYVPFQPFEFKPGDMVAKILEDGSKGGQLTNGIAGQAAQKAGMSPSQSAALQKSIGEGGEAASGTASAMFNNAFPYYPSSGMAPPPASGGGGGGDAGSGGGGAGQQAMSAPPSSGGGHPAPAVTQVTNHQMMNQTVVQAPTGQAPHTPNTGGSPKIIQVPVAAGGSSTP